MKKHPGFFIVTALLLLLACGTISRAAISEPKDFRILYVSESGEELERIEYSVYAVQQVFLDKLQETAYIDPNGYEYRAAGFRWQSWPGKHYTGTASNERSMGYEGIVDALRRAYNSMDPPWSLQASIVMHPTGAKYNAENKIRIIWMNQDQDPVREEEALIGRGESYTDTPPEGYKILSVKAYMLDVWKINNELTIDPERPALQYDKFCDEYSIIYTLELSKEEEDELRGLNTESSEEESGSAEETASDPAESSETTQPQTEKAGNTSAAYPAENASDVPLPSTAKADESFSSGGNRTTLIIGLVMGIVVIYVAILVIGTSRSKNKKKGRKRL